MKFKYYLLILQLEEYKIDRFIKWVFRNLGRKNPQPKKELIWTPKARFLYYISIAGFILITLLLLIFTPPLLSFIIIVLVYLFPFLILPIPLLIMKPYEIINRQVVKRRVQNKIKNIKNLKVVGITGSYGKTSTKNILYQLLTPTKRDQRSRTPFGRKVLKTPLSFNTLFGIAKTIDYELDESYKIFICEMGAYKVGEIRELCEMVPPDIAVLTGINEQHLERFGSLDNTITAKFEILENLKPKGIGVVNLDSDIIRSNLNKLNVNLVGYSIDGNESVQCIDTLRVGEWKIKEGIMHFSLLYKNKSYPCKTKLLGKGHLSNILAASITAILLGKKPDSLPAQIRNLPQIPHRLEIKVKNGVNIIDNAYSSNPSGFMEALDVLSTFEGRRILITPGIVELGKSSDQIHEELGKRAAEICDEIALVGKSHRVQSLRKGITSSSKKTILSELKNDREAEEFVRKRIKPGSTILFENDLPDQYL